MSALWTVADAVKATRGTSDTDWCAWRIEIDSRKVQAGDLFIAIKGEHFDGHDYVADAFSRGAIAALVSHRLEIAGNQLLVADTLKALEDLGKYNRARSNAKVIGITGSVGKTSTKEMLKLALSVHGKTYATTGNYNNHIGTPLNLANLPLDTEFAVFEMGMNHSGEIEHLTHMVRPHIALITGVEAVHLEFFTSVDEIARAKSEIFEDLTDDGIAIINADQPYFSAITPHKITFGENKKADCRLIAYTPTISGCNISANICGTKLDYHLSATGKHWATISLSVLAVISALGLDIKKSAQALADFSEVEGRGRVEILNNFLLINDSYNASPASMAAAFIKTNEVWKTQGEKGQKIAILGNMLELGKNSPELHTKLAEKLLEQGFDKVYTAGSLMQNLYDALPPDLRAGHAPSATELFPILRLQDGDVVLIKGSHGSKMYELAEILKKEKLKNAI